MDFSKLSSTLLFDAVSSNAAAGGGTSTSTARSSGDTHAMFSKMMDKLTTKADSSKDMAAEAVAARRQQARLAAERSSAYQASEVAANNAKPRQSEDPPRAKPADDRPSAKSADSERPRAIDNSKKGSASTEAADKNARANRKADADDKADAQGAADAAAAATDDAQAVQVTADADQDKAPAVDDPAADQPMAGDQAVVAAPADTVPPATEPVTDQTPEQSAAAAAAAQAATTEPQAPPSAGDHKTEGEDKVKAADATIPSAPGAAPHLPPSDGAPVDGSVPEPKPDAAAGAAETPVATGPGEAKVGAGSPAVDPLAGSHEEGAKATSPVDVAPQPVTVETQMAAAAATAAAPVAAMADNATMASTAENDGAEHNGTGTAGGKGNGATTTAHGAATTGAVHGATTKADGVGVQSADAATTGNDTLNGVNAASTPVPAIDGDGGATNGLTTGNGVNGNAQVATDPVKTAAAVAAAGTHQQQQQPVTVNPATVAPTASAAVAGSAASAGNGGAADLLGQQSKGAAQVATPAAPAAADSAAATDSGLGKFDALLGLGSDGFRPVSSQTREAGSVTTLHRTPMGQQGQTGGVMGQVSIQIQKNAQTGNERFTIQLRPEELGRVDVRLEVAGDGKVSAHIAVERAQTLELLQRDQQSLQKALQDAGLNADSSSLSFSLREEGSNPFQDQADQGSGRGGRGRLGAQQDDEGPMPDVGAYNLTTADGRLDVRV